MTLRKVLLLPSLLAVLSAGAQSFAPPNIDFEAGTAAHWACFAGTVSSGHVYSVTPTAPIPGLHTITSGTGTDFYGAFPEVGHGSHSLKLAKDTGDNNADAASNNIHVPPIGSFILIYQYAAVLQDPAHALGQEPAMTVMAIDSATGAALPGAATTISPMASTGFLLSTAGSTSTPVRYKPWTTASLNLAGYAGRTVTLQFAGSGCTTAGHWGYGYVDVSGGFATAIPAPCGLSTMPLMAPAGYASYTWTDSATYTATLGTTATTAVPTPSIPTTYAVILTPTAGHGTVDTFYTTITPSVMPAAITGGGSVAVGATLPLASATSGGIWTSGATSVATVHATTGVVSAVAVGTAPITYSTSVGCLVFTTVTVTPVTSAPLVNAAGNRINMYPNPTAGSVTIELGSLKGDAEALVADATGRLVYRTALTADAVGAAHISLPRLADGIYLVTVRSGEAAYSGRLSIKN